MSVDLEMMLAARNYALKIQEAQKQSNKAWQRRVTTLEEALESVELERDLLRQELQEHQRYFEMREQAMKRAIANGNKVFDKREGNGQ